MKDTDVTHKLTALAGESATHVLQRDTRVTLLEGASVRRMWVASTEGTVDLSIVSDDGVTMHRLAAGESREVRAVRLTATATSATAALRTWIQA